MNTTTSWFVIITRNNALRNLSKRLYKCNQVDLSPTWRLGLLKPGHEQMRLQLPAQQCYGSTFSD